VDKISVDLTHPRRRSAAVLALTVEVPLVRLELPLQGSRLHQQCV
jgi:hypothetical protein